MTAFIFLVLLDFHAVQHTCTWKNGAFLRLVTIDHEKRSFWLGSASKRRSLAFAFGRYAEKSMISSAARGFRVSTRFDSGFFQVGQALDVIAERHHRHPKVGSRLPDRTNQLATHLSDRRKYMLDPSPQLGDSVITPLLTFRELAPRGTHSLNLALIFTSLKMRPPRLAGIALIGVTVRTGVGFIEHSFEMLNVMNSGGTSFDFADQRATPVCIHRELVAKVTLAMLFRPSGIHILLPAFCELLVCGHSPLINQCPIIAADMLLWRRNQRRVNDLTALGQVPLTKRVSNTSIFGSHRYPA